VEETDRGWYMCQVNTVCPYFYSSLRMLSSFLSPLKDPMRSRKGYLQVVGKYLRDFKRFSGY